MHHLGNQTKRTIRLTESYSINLGFVCKDVLPAGAVVTLEADGEVSAFKGTGLPLGILEVGCENANEGVTVQTQFVADVIGKADGDIEAGEQVSVTGHDTTNGRTLTKYKVAEADTYVIGLALSSASDGEEVRVGVYRVFVKL